MIRLYHVHRVDLLSKLIDDIVFVFLLQLYSYEDSYPFGLLIGRCILYIPAVIALAAMLLIFVKLEVTGKTLDRYILKL